MKIDLHPDIERFVLDQVGAGQYQSSAEVVTDALFWLWEHALSDLLADDVTWSTAETLPDATHDTNVLELTAQRFPVHDCQGDSELFVQNERRLAG